MCCVFYTAQWGSYMNTTDHKQCTSSYEGLKQNTKALLDIVPQTFSQKYRNPCWYSSLHIPHTLSRYFRTLAAVRSPIYSNNTNKSEAVIQEFSNSSFLSVMHNQNHQKHSLFCLPFVYLAAFPKCGTTALYRMLTRHPLVAKPARKEGHFWSTFTEDEGTYTDKLLHSLWYLDQFQEASRMISKSHESITVDASPSTLWRVVHEFEEESDVRVLPSIINELTPNARYIVIMRDPVLRLFSDFWFFCSHQNWFDGHGKVVVPQNYLESGRQIFHNFTAEAILSFRSCTFDTTVLVYYECVRRATMATNTSKTGCFPLRLGIGMYYYHIQRWLSVVSRERFLFLRSEDLSLNPYSTMERVWAFLDLPHQTRQEVESLLTHKHKWNTNDWIKSVEYKERFEMLPETHEILRDFYRPHNEKLAELLSHPHYLWEDDGSRL